MASDEITILYEALVMSKPSVRDTKSLHNKKIIFTLCVGGGGCCVY